MGFFTVSKKTPNAAPSQEVALVHALNAAHGIVWFDTTGNILEANQKFCDMLGVDGTAIIGKNHDTFIDGSMPHDLQAASLFEMLMSGASVTDTVKWRIEPSDSVWLHSNYLPVRDRQGAVCKIALIVTDLIQSSQAETDSFSEYNSIQDALARIVFDTDGRILEANDNFLGTMGYSREEIIGQHHSIFVHPDYAGSEKYSAFWQEVLDGDVKTGAFMRFSKSGEERWLQAVYCPVLDDDGKLVKIIKLASDITLQSTATRNASRSTRTQAVIEFNLEGKIHFANDAFLETMGYTLDEVVGRHHSIFVPEGEADTEEYAAHWAALKRGEIHSGEYRRRHKSGRDIWILGIYNLVFGPNGKPVRVVKYANDVTPRIRAEGLIREGLEHLAAGDVSKPIMEPFSAEFEPLRADFNSAVQRLHSSIETVVQASDRIKSGAHDISSSANDLSQRTENQAAALEQTAAAINEMTASVKSTTRIAQHTNGLVGKAKSHASAGTGVMNEARVAMDAIAVSSNEVAQITSVIEDIAFQTNLLALNAGVEAARAGEAGRGFAVVASEVRALAQRSSEAATQISQLIATSVNQVEQGVVLVSRTSQALSEIEGFVAEVADMVGNITAASEEQSGGITEITISISSLEEVTHKNAALAVETNAATQILSSEANALNALTSSFVLNNTKIPEPGMLASIREAS